MQWQNDTQIGDQANAAGRPTIVEHFYLKDSAGNVLTTLTKNAAGVFSHDLPGVGIPTYAMVFSQNGAGSPDVQEVSSPLRAPVVWTYVSAGVYSGTLAGAFPVVPTQTGIGGIGSSSPTSLSPQWQIVRGDSNTVRLNIFDSTGAPADDILSNEYISFVVLPA